MHVPVPQGFGSHAWIATQALPSSSKPALQVTQLASLPFVQVRVAQFGTSAQATQVVASA